MIWGQGSSAPQSLVSENQRFLYGYLLVSMIHKTGSASPTTMFIKIIWGITLKWGFWFSTSVAGQKLCTSHKILHDAADPQNTLRNTTTLCGSPAGKLCCGGHEGRHRTRLLGVCREGCWNVAHFLLPFLPNFCSTTEAAPVTSCKKSESWDAASSAI